MGGCVGSKKAVDGQQQPSKAEVVATDEHMNSTPAADVHTVEPAPEQDPENENAPKTEEPKGEAATQVKGGAAEMALVEDSVDAPCEEGEPEEKDGAVNKTCGWLC